MNLTKFVNSVQEPLKSTLITGISGQSLKPLMAYIREMEDFQNCELELIELPTVVLDNRPMVVSTRKWRDTDVVTGKFYIYSMVTSPMIYDDDTDEKAVLVRGIYSFCKINDQSV